MEKIYLPYVKETETIKTALDRLKKADSRAVIVAREPQIHQLYMNKDIVEASRNNLKYCSHLPYSDGKPVRILTTETNLQPEQMVLTAHGAPDKSSLRQVEAKLALPYLELETELDQSAKEYGILKIPDDAESAFNVLVITRRERLKVEILSAAKVCVCSGGYKHKWNDPPPPNTIPPSFNGKCSRCGNSYECY